MVVVTILALDTETSGLNAQKFLMGCAMKDNEKPLFFDHKEEMLAYLVKEAEKEEKRGHCIHVYAHNHEYDWYSYGNTKDKDVRYLSFSPFIARRRNMWLLDTVAIAKAPLSECATWLGLKKGETPQELKDGIAYDDFHADFELKNRTKQYCAQDTLIVMRLIKHIKNKLDEEGVHPKKLISAGQIGASIFLKQVKSDAILREAWIDRQTGGFIETSEEANKMTRRAYRGGRTEAFQLGEFERTTYFDINSLYPYVLSTMNLPDLREEATKADMESLQENGYGIASAIFTKPDGIDGVPTRFKANSERKLQLVFPKQRATFVGTYTLEELREFKNAGCKIHRLQGWEYPSFKNPLRAFFEEKYELRKGGAFPNAFWKLVMNNIVGKLGQERETTETRFENIGEEREMKRAGFELKDIFEDMGLFKKSNGTYHSRFYCPLLPSHVTATGRLTLWKQIKRIPTEDRLYSDTDSLLILNGEKHRKLFKTGARLGEWKITAENVPARIWGKKAYSFGENIRLSGTPKNQITTENFRTGKITQTKMTGLRQNTEKAGTFTSKSFHLRDTTKRAMTLQEEVKEQQLFIDQYEPMDAKKATIIKEAMECQ